MVPDTPPLPSRWPYECRRPQPPLRRQEAQELPGLGGGWCLHTPQDATPPAPALPLSGAFGRGGILRAGETILRPYRRGGLVRHVNERTYRSPRRFAAEHAIHQALWEAGFPTVEPLGYAWRRRGWGVEGVYLTRLAEGEPWPRRWDLSGSILPELERALDALCAWGLWAPDLNATNVFLPPDGGVLLMDWDRARFAPSADLARQYRHRLVRSLRKLGAPPEAFLGPA